jgi:hypothetical protein
VTASETDYFLGLWASPAGPVLWVRKGRGRYGVIVAIAPGRREGSVRHGTDARVWLPATWDPVEYELRVPLPNDAHNAALVFNRGVDVGLEPDQIGCAVTEDDHSGLGSTRRPSWVLPTSPYRRVPEWQWEAYALTREGTE